MIELFKTLYSCIQRKENTVLVTVVVSSGSTPRGEGARMLVGTNGLLSGTVGGGAVEYRSEKIAKKILETKSDKQEDFILAPNDRTDLGMICGGDVAILFQYLSYENVALATICRAIISHEQTQKPCWLICEIGENTSNSLGFYSEESGWIGSVGQDLSIEELKTSRLRTEGGKNYYVESLYAKGKVYIFGGGHVAQALVPILKGVGFYCVVLEDRQDFLTEELFPEADEKIHIDFGNIEETIYLNEDDYGIVMTRGHQFDFQLEKQLLKTTAYYIGVMGSKTKVATHRQNLEAIGFSKNEIGRMNMPIGLKIKAETPAELAISIAGELIMKRAEK